MVRWVSMPLISKTTFLQFQMCPKDTWLMLHKPKLVAQFKPTEFELHLMEQGNEVEGVARDLSPNAVLVTETGEATCRETERLMQAGTPAIFQAKFVADGFIAKCDVLVRAGDEALSISTCCSSRMTARNRLPRFVSRSLRRWQRRRNTLEGKRSRAVAATAT